MRLPGPPLPLARLALVVAGLLVGACALAPARAAAHGLTGRGDLPIPAWLFGWAATLVLVVSFVALAALWVQPRLERDGFRPLPARLGRALTSRPVEILCGAAGVFLLGLVVVSGLFGRQSPTANFAPTFVYVVFWVGLVPLSVLFGDVFRAFNPWRALGRATGWAARRVLRDGVPEPLRYPERLGYWPAVGGLLVFSVLELVAQAGDQPRVVALATLAYTGVTLLGMGYYGERAWTQRGEAFSVYFGLLARIAPLARRGREIGLRVRCRASPG